MGLPCNILDAARLIGLKFRSGSMGRVEVEAQCPFCYDHDFHLSLNRAKNVFRCNRCKESGGVLQLYAKVVGVSIEEAKEALKEKSISTFQYPSQKVPPQPKLYPTKPVEERDAVYKRLLEYLPLSDIHLHNLKKRGLPLEAIQKNYYRSIPLMSEVRQSIVKKLAMEYDLRGIPGFYTSKDNQWDMYCKSGILIPVRDLSNKIQGMQIRLDDTSNRKYRWLSSSYFNNGTKAEPWVHVTGNIHSTSAYVTEGPLKADVASCLSGGKLFIAIPGINCTEGLPEVLKQLGIIRVAEALDMDKLIKPEVSAAVETIRKIVQSCGIEYVPFKWNSRFKGIDDYLYSRVAAG